MQSQSLQQRGRPATSNGSFFTRSFTRRETVRADNDTDAKGPIGLTTLHDPGENTILDLVFVHGLNGGSQSTWTRNGNLSLFWLREWLPNDNAFRDVRIHTFGYASGLSRESVLHVPDFARSLLSSLHDAPSIERDSRVSTLPPVPR
jgi:hypothetical protein